MNDLDLPALSGTNPVSFLAALGVLDAVFSSHPDVSLRWTDELVPHAVLEGGGDLDLVLDVLDQDRAEWIVSTVLHFPQDSPLNDAKPVDALLRDWFVAAADKAGPQHDADLLCAIVAEGAFDGNQKAKPTHLHFTAGQQQFLEMARTLASNVDRERLREALCGPWRYNSSLPSFSWDSRGERIYAIRATNPSKGEKRLGVPGADWLAFRGLLFYPVTRTVNGSLRTTACDTQWKRSAFRWPLWSVPGRRDAVRSLVADRTLIGDGARLRAEVLDARGIFSVLRAPIRRTDQGGYGSFGPPEVLASAAVSDRMIAPVSI
jgi:hypothetical protein